MRCVSFERNDRCWKMTANTEFGSFSSAAVPIPTIALLLFADADIAEMK